ncbi:MAG: tRNA pseudouridine(55) synthase TruB [Rickettsiales bacterium]|nr:tRNA pseudouridine(55) synthase TruB [Rickettsiales bacterium]|tara:strand:- start:10068 stop:10961 length:894 start_codon:yes stop_codon:yes gene_type:complete
MNSFSGWVILDKPAGITSARLLNRLKNHLPKKTKIGHAGTLDQLASGVLPVAIGEATKLIQYAQLGLKTYDFVVTWGKQTTTDDAEGDAIATSQARPTQEQVTNILSDFKGEILQVPPKYSALKIKGKRSSDRIRSGEEVDLAARQINISKLNIIAHTPNHTRFTITCGKGTYVRSIARDMGIELGCYGHITSLRRLEVGGFTLERSILGQKLLDQEANVDIKPHVYACECVLDDILDTTVTKDQVKHLRQGQAIRVKNLPEIADETMVSCLNEEKILIALTLYKDGLLYPKRIFNI